MIWFSADWHLGHAGILIHHAPRLNAFEYVEEMDAQILDQTNSVVQPDDELYFLGDFCWKASRAGHYRQRLNVRNMHVCQGNHDSSSLAANVSSMDHMLFRKIKWQGKTYKFHMCHYPMMSWQGLHYGGIHLYGHSHGIYEGVLDGLHPGRRAMDVGIDVAYEKLGMWRPFSIDEVISKLVGDEEVKLTRETRLPGPRII